MKKPRRQAFIRLHVSAWLLVVLAGCSKSRDSEAVPDREREEPIRVTVSAIQPWQEGASRHLPGVVRPGRRAVLSTRGNGTLQSTRVEAGDRVAAGEELAQVESRDLDAVVFAAEAHVKAAEAAHEQAVRDAERLQRLAEEDLIARNRLEHARVKQRTTAAQAENARAELTAQRVNRGYAQITAPFRGIVSEVLVDEGSFIGPGQPVLVLEDRTTLRIDIPVSRQMAGLLASNKKLSVVSPRIREPLSVRYVAIVPALETGSAGQLVRFSVENPPPALDPGQVVDVRLHSPARKDWVALPRAALIRRGQLTATLVLEPTREDALIRLRWIRIAGGTAGDDPVVPVSQGLEVGEWVVLHPAPDLRDGQPVDPERVSP